MISFILECTIDKLLFTDRHFVVAVRVKWLTLFLAFFLLVLLFFLTYVRLDDLKIDVRFFFWFYSTEPVLMTMYILLFFLKCHCNYCTAIDGSFKFGVFFGQCVSLVYDYYFFLNPFVCIRVFSVVFLVILGLLVAYEMHIGVYQSMFRYILVSRLRHSLQDRFNFFYYYNYCSYLWWGTNAPLWNRTLFRFGTWARSVACL